MFFSERRHLRFTFLSLSFILFFFIFTTNLCLLFCTFYPFFFFFPLFSLFLCLVLFLPLSYLSNLFPFFNFLFFSFTSWLSTPFIYLFTLRFSAVFSFLLFFLSRFMFSFSTSLFPHLNNLFLFFLQTFSFFLCFSHSILTSDFFYHATVTPVYLAEYLRGCNCFFFLFCLSPTLTSSCGFGNKPCECLWSVCLEGSGVQYRRCNHKDRPIITLLGIVNMKVKVHMYITERKSSTRKTQKRLNSHRKERSKYKNTHTNNSII